MKDKAVITLRLLCGYHKIIIGFFFCHCSRYWQWLLTLTASVLLISISVTHEHNCRMRVVALTCHKDKPTQAYKQTRPRHSSDVQGQPVIRSNRCVMCFFCVCVSSLIRSHAALPRLFDARRGIPEQLRGRRYALLFLQPIIGTRCFGVTRPAER